MSGMLNKRHATATRDRIRVGVIIDRLQKHVLGKVEMSQAQVTSARILLDKALSNAPTEQVHSGEVKIVCTLKPSPLDE